MTEAQPSHPRSAVLVHGLWGVPGDWQWVQRPLESHGVEVSVPDLPSHRCAAAGRLEDIEEVRSAIRSVPAPAVVVGWSYGSDVVGVAAHGEGNVARLVYVSSIPQQVHPEPLEGRVFDDSPIIEWDDQDRFVINDWWKQNRDFPPEVWEHIAANPRRAASRRTLTDPIPAAAWQSIPTTILLGTRDEFTGEEQKAWARQSVADVREVDCDHFIMWSLADLVAEVILEELPVRQHQ